MCRCGVRVPAAWPLSARYNGSVDSSEGGGGNAAWGRREPRSAPAKRLRHRLGMCNSSNMATTLLTGASPARYADKTRFAT